MSRIYTRRGDAGQTSDAQGRRQRKDALPVEVNGTIDELNSVIGLARAAVPAADDRLSRLLLELQHDLFRLGATLAGAADQPGRASTLTAADVQRLEGWIDRCQAELKPLRHFILPGGSAAAAGLHVARTVCRRAERRLVALAAVQPVAADVLAFVNRLSDLLFVLARWANHLAGIPDAIWPPGSSAPPEAAPSPP